MKCQPSRHCCRARTSALIPESIVRSGIDLRHWFGIATLSRECLLNTRNNFQKDSSCCLQSVSSIQRITSQTLCLRRRFDQQRRHRHRPARLQLRAFFETNVFGAAVVIDSFLPLLRASKYHDRRVFNVASGLGQVGMAGAHGSPFYAKGYAVPEYHSSNTAVNRLTAVNSVLLADEGISVNPAAPGFCRTKSTRGQGIKDTSDGAKVIVRAATAGDPKELYGALVV